ncbi:MAG: DedA family protein [Acidobacteriota bacterium]|nr:DedA family protein [Acidobacteriota bacterium]
MKSFVEFLFSIPAGWVVATVFLMAALETAVVVGLFLPGEITIVLGGVAAAHGKVPLAAVIAAAVAGPIAGDVAGYILGRRYGETVVRRKLGKRRWRRAHAALSHGSGWKIVLTRIFPLVRAVLPTTAGAVETPPSRFFVWEVPTAAVWGAGSALAGYVAGRDYEQNLHWGERFSLVAGALVAIAVAWFAWRTAPSPLAGGVPVTAGRLADPRGESQA